MKEKVNEFVDRFPDFHSREQTAQIVRLVYFHTIVEGRESINKNELNRLFELSGLAVPKNLARLLGYLSGKGEKLININGEFSLRREVGKQIDNEMHQITNSPNVPANNSDCPFYFQTSTIADNKVGALLMELTKCYPLQCWNACGLLIRIIIERTLDSVDPSVKAKTGLKDKINVCRGIAVLSKSLREALDGLLRAKIIGDIAAHHSKILLDKSDIVLVLPAFRILLKEVQTT